MLVKNTYICLFLFLFSCFSCKEKAESLSICFTGDVLLDRGVRQEIERNGSLDSLFVGVHTLFNQSDAVVINLECPIANISSPINKKYIFRANAEWAKDLKRNGITHTALANNHTIDQGREGLIDTYNNLSNADIITIGYGGNQLQACEPTIVKKGKIEVVLFNSVLVPLENWVCLDDEPGICQASSDEISKRIIDFKQTNPSSYVVVLLHWGAEYHQTSDLIQRKGARKLIDSGANAIIGHHPHVIQEEEFYKGCPIFYSLGNFIFDQTKPHTDEALVVNLIFNNKKMDIEKRIAKIERYKPTFQKHPD